MKRIVAWITYILNLLVALPVIGVLFYFGAEVNAYFSTIVCIVLFRLPWRMVPFASGRSVKGSSG